MSTIKVDSISNLLETAEVSVSDLGTVLSDGGSALVGYMPAGTGAVATTVQVKLNDQVSVKDFGAVGDGVTDDTAEINAAAVAAGVGGSLYFPRTSAHYKVNGTLTKLAGQIWHGDGWSTVVGTTAIQGGSQIIQYNTTDIPLIQTYGASDAAQVERGGIRDLALVNSVSNATVGTGFQAINSRQELLDNVYVTGFNIGIEQGNNCWQWAMRNVRIFNAAKCLFAHDEGEDSTYTSCVFRPYRNESWSVHMKNMSHTNLFLGCDISNAGGGASGGGVWLEQGDSNGNGTGTPYPMHATFINCQFEECFPQAVLLTTSNGSASNGLHPQAIFIGCRAYNFSSPNTGQVFITATNASYVSVDGLQTNGYSTGISIGAGVNKVSWKPGPGATFGTAQASGTLERIFQSPTCRLKSAALSYVATNFTTIPFTTITSDVDNWYSSNGIKPKAPQATRFKAQIATTSAPAGRYVLILKKNGTDTATLVDFYVTTAGQPFVMSGDAIDIPNGGDTYTVLLYSTASFTIDVSGTTFTAECVGS